MKTLLCIWQVSLRSARNELRADAPMRGIWVMVLLGELGFGVWSAIQLSARLLETRATRPEALASELWVVALGVWVTAGLFTLIAFMRQGLSSSEAEMLLTLPLSPGALWRALYVVMLGEGIGNLVQLILGIIGVSLVLSLGTGAIPWLAILVLGTAVAVWVMMVSTLFVLRLGRWLLPFGILLAGALLIAYRDAAPQVSVDALTLEWVGAVLVFWLLIALGPLAGPAGRLYCTVYNTVQGSDRARAALSLPGLGKVCAVLAPRRTLSAALFTKMLLSQSRHWFAWGRLVMLGVYALLFPMARLWLGSMGFADRLIVCAYASALALASVVESAPYAISGEGNRLAIYLTAPLTWGAFLRARLFTYLVPVISLGLVSSILLGAWTRLALIDLVELIPLVLLILVGVTTFYVWASVADENLNAPAEDPVQTLLLEEAPISQRRMAVLTLGLALFAAMLVSIWKLPLVVAGSLLLLADGVLLAAAWHFGHARLAHLLERG